MKALAQVHYFWWALFFIGGAISLLQNYSELKLALLILTIVMGTIGPPIADNQIRQSILTGFGGGVVLLVVLIIAEGISLSSAATVFSLVAAVGILFDITRVHRKK